MDSHILQHYLQLGFGTRYMRTDTIGKYGVGAKLAALNYGKRIDVWSRDKKGGDWLHVEFDLDKALEEEIAGDSPGIDPPDTTPIPEDLSDMLPKGTGTVVVWSKVDRLEEGRRAPDSNQLRVEVEKELSRSGFRIGDGKTVDLIRYTAWLIHERKTPKPEPDGAIRCGNRKPRPISVCSVNRISPSSSIWNGHRTITR